jgi:hypothetical protein
MDGFDLNERRITAAEFASILAVTEDDVLLWMLAGHIPYVDGPDGAPQVRIREQHSQDGSMTCGFATYLVGNHPDFEAEVARRRRELPFQAIDCGEVNPDALTEVLAGRLGTVMPVGCTVDSDGAMIWLRAPNGSYAGIECRQFGCARRHPACPQLKGFHVSRPGRGCC